MKEKRNIVIQNDKEMDKEELENTSVKLRDNLKRKRNLSELEQQVLMEAIEKIEKEEAKVDYEEKLFNPKAGQEALIKDVLNKNIDVIIANDADRFSKIGDEPAVSGIIAGRCSVYTLDGKINTILPKEKFTIKIINAIKRKFNKIL